METEDNSKHTHEEGQESLQAKDKPLEEAQEGAEQASILLCRKEPTMLDKTHHQQPTTQQLLAEEPKPATDAQAATPQAATSTKTTTAMAATEELTDTQAMILNEGRAASDKDNMKTLTEVSHKE